MVLWMLRLMLLRVLLLVRMLLLMRLVLLVLMRLLVLVALMLGMRLVMLLLMLLLMLSSRIRRLGGRIAGELIPARHVCLIRMGGVHVVGGMLGGVGVEVLRRDGANLPLLHD